MAAVLTMTCSLDYERQRQCSYYYTLNSSTQPWLTCTAKINDGKVAHLIEWKLFISLALFKMYKVFWLLKATPIHAQLLATLRITQVMQESIPWRKLQHSLSIIWFVAYTTLCTPAVSCFEVMGFPLTVEHLLNISLASSFSSWAHTTRVHSLVWEQQP